MIDINKKRLQELLPFISEKLQFYKITVYAKLHIIQEIQFTQTLQFTNLLQHSQELQFTQVLHSKKQIAHIQHHKKLLL